jgi:hypothetical protein
LLLEEVSFIKEADGRNEEFDDDDGKCNDGSVADVFPVLFDELLIAVMDTVGTKRAAIKRVLTNKLILSI